MTPRPYIIPVIPGLDPSLRLRVVGFRPGRKREPACVIVEIGRIPIHPGDVEADPDCPEEMVRWTEAAAARLRSLVPADVVDLAEALVLDPGGFSSLEGTSYGRADVEIAILPSEDEARSNPGSV